MTDTLKPTTAPPGRNAKLPGGIWPTRAAGMVRHAIEACRTGRHLGVITGPSGTGKTTAARAAVQAATEDDFEAHYLAMTVTAASLQPGLVRIGKGVAAPVHTGMGAAEAHDAIASRMADWRRGGVIVLDEAQQMGDELIFAIRDLSDEMERRGRPVGIVLLGDATLAERIAARTGRTARQFAPLRGRLGVMVELPPPNADEFRAIAGAEGVNQPQAADLVARVGSSHGNLHSVARLLTRARVIAGPDNAMTLGVLRTAAQVAGVTP